MEIPLDRLVVNQRYSFRYEPPLPQDSPILSEGLGTLSGRITGGNIFFNSLKDVTPINRQHDITISGVFPDTYGQSILHFYSYVPPINSFEGAGTRRKSRRSMRLKRKKSRRSKKTRNNRRSTRRRRSMRGG